MLNIINNEELGFISPALDGGKELVVTIGPWPFPVKIIENNRMIEDHDKEKLTLFHFDLIEDSSEISLQNNCTKIIQIDVDVASSF